MEKFKDFNNLYSIAKTLRFELKPIGKTIDNILNNKILCQDQHLANSYIRVKDIIDEYHKFFINDVLDLMSLSVTALEDYLKAYKSSSSSLKSIQEKLREQIVDNFANDNRFKKLFSKELLHEILPEFVTDTSDKAIISEFHSFTTYFTRFHENRKNLYSKDKRATAIAYRLIHENLPRFIDNIDIFDKIYTSPIAEKLTLIYTDFAEYLNVNSIKEMFSIEYFNTVLSQRQIDVYNAIIGGKTLDDGTKRQGLNEYINLYNQQQNDKSRRIPKLKPLYKQLLSEREAISWLPDHFSSDQEVLNAIQEFYQTLNLYVINNSINGEYSIKDILQSLSDFDLKKVFIRNDQQLSDISQRVYEHWGFISNALKEQLKQIHCKTSRESEESYIKRITTKFKEQNSFSIAQIHECAKSYDPNCSKNSILDYFSKLVKTNDSESQSEDIFSQIENAYKNASELLSTPYPPHKNLAQDKINIEKIKTLLDAIKKLQYLIKPLLGEGTEANKDEKFYAEFTALYDKLDKITPLYDMIRNYVTRKPYSTKKIKLNFENYQLMNGWDHNKETDYTTIILRNNGLYYLAIMDRRHRRVFSTDSLPNDGDCYEKMVYKLLPGPNKMLPKVLLPKSNPYKYGADEQLVSNYNNRTHKKGATFNLNDCQVLIDFFKSCLKTHVDWKIFDFKFSETSTYDDIRDFYQEVEQQGYKIEFKKVSVNYINQLVDEGKIYLFQIYNKDFSPHSKGTPNLHTIYWKMLFDEHNLANVVYKLNGNAEVFFRESSIVTSQPTHHANQPIANKNRSNPKTTTTLSYNLTKDKRYTVDKFLLHIPITLNFKSKKTENINTLVNSYIKQSDDIHIIGIDRGERHLLYLTLINTKGEIVQQFSLNEIINHHNNIDYITNYHNLLTERENDRLKSRQSWQTIENIKDLKKGYLSQAVNVITNLMTKYNAIVVLEDLNRGFIRGRQKVEASVYQQFEKMLIDKLNYLVDKKKSPNEPGGALNAYQLTNKFESFTKLETQCGFLFYVPAWNTSKMDPLTGFVNLLDTRYETIEKAKTFFNKFDSIKYNSEHNYFEFALNYSNFTTRACGAQNNWVICTIGTRIESHRDITRNSQWISSEIVLTEKYKDLFSKYDIDINSNLKDEINRQTSAEFFKGLLYLLKLTLQIRNSAIGTDIDYLQSPVADENGIFFNSNQCGSSLPENADANGAYNIARKGLWIVNQIKSAEKTDELNLKISNHEWLHFAQTKPYLKQEPK